MSSGNSQPNFQTKPPAWLAQSSIVYPELLPSMTTGYQATTPMQQTQQIVSSHSNVSSTQMNQTENDSLMKDLFKPILSASDKIDFSSFAEQLKSQQNDYLKPTQNKRGYPASIATRISVDNENNNDISFSALVTPDTAVYQPMDTKENDDCLIPKNEPFVFNSMVQNGPRSIQNNQNYIQNNNSMHNNHSESNFSADNISETNSTKGKRKAGRKRADEEPKSKRTAQNRAAQRAFRERKEKHLRDLENRVKELEEVQKQIPQSHSALIEENLDLRRRLAQLEYENASLKGLSYQIPSTEIPTDKTQQNKQQTIHNLNAKIINDNRPVMKTLDFKSFTSGKQSSLSYLKAFQAQNSESDSVSFIFDSITTSAELKNFLAESDLLSPNLSMAPTLPNTLNNITAPSVIPSKLISFDLKPSVATDLSVSLELESVNIGNKRSAFDELFNDIQPDSSNNNRNAQKKYASRTKNMSQNTETTEINSSMNSIKSASFTSIPTIQPPSQVSDKLDFDFDDFLDISQAKSDLQSSRERAQINVVEVNGLSSILSNQSEGKEVHEVRENMMEVLDSETINILNQLFLEEAKNDQIKEIQIKILKACYSGDKAQVTRLVADLNELQNGRF